MQSCSSDHIVDILVLQAVVLKKITGFLFSYGDISYGAKNNAVALTGEAIVRLAKACPNLKEVQLQATHNVGDVGLLGFLRFCPNLTLIEISGITGGGYSISEKTLDALREKPYWVRS